MHLRDSGGIFGAERVILTLAKHIDKKVFHFSLLCMGRRDQGEKELTSRAAESGSEVISVDVKGRLDFSAIRHIRKVFRSNQIALFHSHDFKSNLYGLLASLDLRVGRVTTAHGSTRDTILKRVYLLLDERFICQLFDKIIAVSRDIKGQLLQKKISNSKIEVIQNGIDPSIIESESQPFAEFAFDVPHGHTVFAVIGRLFPDKGHRFFLEALAKLSRSHGAVHGLIVGDGPAREDIEAQVMKLGLQDRVTLCGLRKDMKCIYDRIDCLVIPSLREGLPYVLLEAMSNRIPVVATPVGDIPLLIEDGVTGYLAPPEDADTLCARMAGVLNNSSKQKDIVERAYRLVRKEYSAERMVRSIEALYMSVIGVKNSAQG